MASEFTPPDSSTLYFSCMECLILVRSYDAAAAHFSAKHGDQRAEHRLDVVQVLSDPERDEYIAACRVEFAQIALASAVEAQDNLLKRRIAKESEPSPTRLSKAPRLTTASVDDNSVTTAVQVAQTNHYYPSPTGDAPAPATLPSLGILLITRGARIIFTPPIGVDTFDGLLKSIAAAYDAAVPGAEEFNWIAAAHAKWEVSFGKIGGGRCRIMVISCDEDVKMCLHREPMKSRIRVMVLGEQDGVEPQSSLI